MGLSSALAGPDGPFAFYLLSTRLRRPLPQLPVISVTSPHGPLATLCCGRAPFLPKGRTDYKLQPCLYGTQGPGDLQELEWRGRQVSRLAATCHTHPPYPHPRDAFPTLLTVVWPQKMVREALHPNTLSLSRRTPTDQKGARRALSR